MAKIRQIGVKNHYLNKMDLIPKMTAREKMIQLVQENNRLKEENQRLKVENQHNEEKFKKEIESLVNRHSQMKKKFEKNLASKDELLEYQMDEITRKDEEIICLQKKRKNDEERDA